MTACLNRQRSEEIETNGREIGRDRTDSSFTGGLREKIKHAEREMEREKGKPTRLETISILSDAPLDRPEGGLIYSTCVLSSKFCIAAATSRVPMMVMKVRAYKEKRKERTTRTINSIT